MAERPGAASLRYVETRRMCLVAASAELISIDLEGQAPLSAALGVKVPDNWPPQHHDRPAMNHALNQLGDPAEQGWSLWYPYLKAPEVEELIGICGFKGRPDARGSVEISYAILNQFRSRGLASEAVEALVRWAFSHRRVTEICAETLPYLKQSIRVLEKCGFSQAGPGSEHGVVRYTLGRARLR